MIALNKTIRLFLDSIGRRDEYEFYLDKFLSDHSACFALLCPDFESIENGVEMLAFDLHFLLRLELVPAVLLAGPESKKMQLNLSSDPVFIFQDLGKNVDIDGFIERARKNEKVPVLVAENSELDDLLIQLVPRVAARVHLIRAAGGLKNSSGEILPYIYTHTDNLYPLEEMEFDYLALARKLIEQRAGVHVSITSPINLLREIFTVKGAGTLFRKGSEIVHYPMLDGVDRCRLLDLLEKSFSKKLDDKSFLERIRHSYIEKEYRGAVLLEEHPAGLYLSKFAVGREARGEGIAMDLWRKVCADHHALFWRSNVENSFNSWYDKQADGYHTSGKWQVFWRNVSADDISSIIQYCNDRDEDFKQS